jgi:hypothetical protein
LFWLEIHHTFYLQVPGKPNIRFLMFFCFEMDDPRLVGASRLFLLVDSISFPFFSLPLPAKFFYMLRINNQAILLFLTLLIFPLMSFSQEITDFPKHYICTKIDTPIIIDGLALEDVWKTAEWSGDFVDIEGDMKPTPEFRTRVKMLWDEANLYIFAELEEPHIWATMNKRDDIIYFDNDFEVFIDPDGDNHNYYEIEVNALETVFDLFMSKPYKSGGKPLIGWDLPGLETAIDLQGTINDPTDTDLKWTVEMAIPLESFRYFLPGKELPKNGNIWRINFSRVQWIAEIVDGKYNKQINPETGNSFPEMNWVWSPQGVIDMHRPETWGYLIFTDQTDYQPLTENEIDRYFEEKMILVKLYDQQKEFYSKQGKYAKSMFELNKQGRSTSNTIYIEATSEQFLISLEAEDGKKLFIDHEKKIWVE